MISYQSSKKCSLNWCSIVQINSQSGTVVSFDLNKKFWPPEEVSLHLLSSLAVLSALSEGLPLCSGTQDLFISPTTSQSPLQTPISPKVQISERVCIIVSCCRLCLSPCLEWHHSTKKKGEVCLEVVACLKVAVTTASSIPREGEVEAYHSEKLLKQKKRVVALGSRVWWVNKLTRIHVRHLRPVPVFSHY